MAKPTKNRIVTGSACLNYVDNAIGFVSFSDGQMSTVDSFRLGLDRLDDFHVTGEFAGQIVRPSDYQSYIQYLSRREYLKFNHSDRVCGLILGENDDGSYKIAVLGSESINPNTLQRNFVIVNVSAYPTNVTEDDKYNFADLVTYGGSPSEGVTTGTVTDQQGSVSVDRAMDFKLNLYDYTGNTIYADTFYTSGKYRGNVMSGYDNELVLTSNKNNTLVLGIPVSEMIANMPFNTQCYVYDTYNTFFDAWEGDLYTLMQTVYSDIRLQSSIKPAVVISEGNVLNLYTRPQLGTSGKIAGYEGKTHAFNFTPFNLILTRNESQALAYLANGTLPSDAFLYPLDWQNLPRTDGTPSSDEEDPDYKPPSGEDGDSGIDGTPTRDADPQITSNMLTNNNLYWLQAGQLESFITWFWQNAGEIIELDDLWDRIKGLYNDLASAIINIRYFPVDPYYIGGVSDTTNIVLSSIEMPISGIKKLNKTKLRKRTLGEISIPNKYNAFTDYSPYTSLMLYLPFHGWIDLDIDIFTGNKLQVRCVYDHISGTIQYGVYVISKNKEFLLNTVIAKMAVDIPITLQSKNDRDSAIFNNVTNAFGNLLGAGASAVSGNPIGLVMSTAGVASSGTQSAPLKVNGTVGETGAFFMPNKCAVYIKRPSYNRPKNYGARVGFPSNKGGKLSEFSGFTTVYNPQITFSGNTNADNVTIKPLQSEIDEIYTALEKGVIL